MMRRVGLIALGALVVLVAGWYALALRPEQKHIKSLQTESASALADVATLQAQFEALKAQKKQVPSEEKSLKKLAQLIPAGPSLDQLIKSVNDAAKRADVRLTSIGVAAPAGWGQTTATGTGPKTSGPNVLAVTIGLQGADQGALAFVADVEQEPRLFTVSSLTLYSAPKAAGKATGSAKDSYTVAMSAFYVSSASNNPVFPGGNS